MKQTLSEQVYEELKQIPKGTVMTYKELASRIGYPKATRRIATIVGQNTNPIVIPCHRVIRSDYQVGEYTYNGKRNQKKKIELLTSEGIHIRNKKVILQK